MSKTESQVCANDSCCYQDADVLIKRIRMHLGNLFENLFSAFIMRMANVALIVSWSDLLRVAGLRTGFPKLSSSSAERT